MKYRAKKQHIIHNTKKLLCVALVVATHLLQTGAPAARAAECNEARARIVAYNFCVRQGKVNPAAGAEGEEASSECFDSEAENNALAALLLATTGLRLHVHIIDNSNITTAQASVHL